MVREMGLDLRCGGGRLAALDCPRQSIHYRSRSSPIIFKCKKPPPDGRGFPHLVREGGLEPPRPE